MPVLYGVLMYMGVNTLNGMQFIDRLFLMFMPGKHQPDYLYLRHVPLKKVTLLVLISLYRYLIPISRFTFSHFSICVIGGSLDNQNNTCLANFPSYGKQAPRYCFCLWDSVCHCLVIYMSCTFSPHRLTSYIHSWEISYQLNEENKISPEIIFDWSHYELWLFLSDHDIKIIFKN